MRNKPQDYSTINIPKVLRNHLREMKRGTDTYEAVIWRLIEEYEEAHGPQTYSGLMDSLTSQTGVPDFTKRR